MSVTVDSATLPAETLGLKTVGQVLAHLQRDSRLVVHLLIDGAEPDLDRMSSVRQSPLLGHTLYIETADAGQMAMEVLQEVESHLAEADAMRSAAADLLQQNQCAAAMEKLGFCLTTWQHAQQSVLKTAQLLRLDLDAVSVGDESLPAVLSSFTDQLRAIKQALEDRDYVALGDVLLYEMTDTTPRWLGAIEALRVAVQAGHHP